MTCRTPEALSSLPLPGKHQLEALDAIPLKGPQGKHTLSQLWTLATLKNQALDRLLPVPVQGIKECDKKPWIQKFHYKFYFPDSIFKSHQFSEILGVGWGEEAYNNFLVVAHHNKRNYIKGVYHRYRSKLKTEISPFSPPWLLW